MHPLLASTQSIITHLPHPHPTLWDLQLGLTLYSHMEVYRTSIPLISPHPHEVDRNALEEHPLVGQVDTK